MTAALSLQDSRARYLAWLFTVLGGVLAVIAGGNLALNGDGRFPWTPQERFIAEAALAGAPVSGNVNVSEKVVQRLIIRTQRTVPDVIVLGSSRSMEISQDMLPVGRLQNHSVSSAKLVDHFGIIANYLSSSRLPRIVLVGVDPWLFNRGAEVRSTTEVFRADIAELSRQLGLPIEEQLRQPAAPAIDRLLSLRNLVTATRELVRRAGDPCGQLERRADENSPCMVRRPDGSIKRTREDLALTPQQVSNAIRTAHRERLPMYQFESYGALDPDLRHAFVAFVDLLRKREVEVVFFLPPYHPLVRELYERTDWGLVTESDRFVRELARARNIRIIGAYDPRDAGCDAAEFFDDIHPRPSCLGRIFGRVDWGERGTDPVNPP